MTNRETMAVADSFAGRQLRKAMFYMNTAYVLADVIHTYMMEAEAAIGRIGSELTQDNKRRFNRCRKITSDAKRAAMEIATEIYRVNSADEACADSDFLAEAVKLVVTRTGKGGKSENEMLDLLSALPAASAETVSGEPVTAEEEQSCTGK